MSAKAPNPMPPPIAMRPLPPPAPPQKPSDKTENNVKVAEIENIKRQLHHLIDRIEGLKTK